MKLLQLKATNFRGLPDLTLEFDGQNVSLSAGNESGKSTILLVYLTLMTPCKINVQNIFDDRKQTAKIEATMDNGGVPLKLCKTIFDSEIKCFVNGDRQVMSENDFQAWINDNVCPTEAFRLLSLPETFFKADSEQAYEILMKLAKDYSVREVLQTSDIFTPLIGVESVERHSRALVAENESIDNKITATAAKIEIMQETISQAIGLTANELLKITDEIVALQKQQTANTERIVKIKSEHNVPKLATEIYELDQQIEKAQQFALKEKERFKLQLSEQISKLQKKKDNLTASKVAKMKRRDELAIVLETATAQIKQRERQIKEYSE